MNDLNLACFLSVARTLSFSVTARILSIPQQTVSRNIQKLEEELGYVLLNRESQTVTLTRAGDDFFRWAQGLDQRLLTANQAMQRVTASLGIGWGDWTGCPAPLEQAILAFQKQHPAVELHVTQGSHQELLEFMDTGLIDMVLLPARCLGAADGLQLEGSGISLPLYVLVGAENPLRTLKGSENAILSALPQLTPPLLCDGERDGGRNIALSDLFGCSFSHGAVQPMPNVDSCYVGLVGGPACTITPMNPWIEEQASLAVLCPAGASADLVFARQMKEQNPWCSILIQLVKEAAK